MKLRKVLVTIELDTTYTHRELHAALREAVRMAAALRSDADVLKVDRIYTNNAASLEEMFGALIVKPKQ